MIEYATKDDGRQTTDGSWDGGRRMAEKRSGPDDLPEPLAAICRLLSQLPSAVRRLPSV
jgi:hypothetical protein